ncbi:MAG: LamG domain-containing protein, partial [Lentisphaeria bacterium]|nr:LamG domain-containing protein [Lentisphaeria bacterium]
LSAAVNLPVAFGQSAGTVTFRVKPEGWTGAEKDFRNFIHLTNEAGESLSIYRLHNSDGTFIVTLMGKDGKRADAGFDMSNWQKDTWYNIAVCWDAEYIYIYQNGQLVRRSSVRGFKFTQPFNQLEIGKYLRTYNGGYMLMDDIMLYNGVLSDTEAKEATAPVTPGIRSGATRVTIDEASKQLTFKVPGSDKIFSTAGNPLFAFRLYDETARRDNDKPLNGTGHFWGTNLVMSGQEITSNDCELLKIEYKTADSAVLFFKHPAAEVELTIMATATGVKSFAKITNTGDTPIYEFTVLPFSFQLGEGENVITPFPPHIGIEFSKVISYKWAMNYAWDGFLVREGSGFLAVDRYQDIETLYLPGWGTVTGGENNTLSFLGTTLIFIRKGESRTSIGLSVRHFADIKSWADNYRQLNFPRGMKTLAEKLTKDQFDKFSRAYLAPTWATIRSASALVATAPGTFIVHPPIYMHACKGIRSNWDAFPNYFPPIARVGTMDEFAALIRQIVDSGNLFMPRNSFYYWGVGSDYAERYDLERSAIVRIDGKPRTAMWAQPGYMVSPSSRDVLAHLEEIYQRWISMGTNAYFTNVIGAQLPDHNAFDFHPDAPAPDAFYTQLFNIHKLHGTRIPLMSEHGAFWIMPYQVGICGVGGWLRPLPGNLEPKGTVVRSAPEVCLTLMHEYIRFYTSNTGYLAAPAGPRGIAYSLTHGIGLKAGFLNDFEMTREKRRWMRTTALIAGEIHSLNYGQPLDSYTDKDGMITAVYGGNLNIANFSDKPLAMQAGEYSTVIAPEGFLFVSKDHNRIAGYFTEFAGNKFAEPVLLVILKKGEIIELYAPLTLDPVAIEIDGVKTVIPAYPAVITPEVPGVKVNVLTGTSTASPVVADTARVPRYGQDQEFPVTAPAAGSEVLLAWRKGEKLPAALQSLAAMQTPAGLRITAPQELTFENISGKIAVEIGVVLNRYPEEKIQPDLHNILSSGNNFKLSFNTYNGRVFFTAGSARQLSTWGMSFESRKYNMIKVVLDGQQQLVDFNGLVVKGDNPLHFPAGVSKWIIGCTGCDYTVTSIRVSKLQ